MLIKFFLSKKFENKKIIKDKNKKIIKIFKKVLNEKSEILKSLGKNYSYNFTKKQLKKYKSLKIIELLGWVAQFLALKQFMILKHKINKKFLLLIIL